MADDVGVEPDMIEHRKSRDHEVGDSTAKDGDMRIEDELSVHGSNTKRVQSAEKAEKKSEEIKPSKMKRILGNLGLDAGTVLMMFKYVKRSQVNDID